MPVLNTSEWKADLPAVTKTMPATEKREQPSRGFLATAAGSMRSSKTLFSLVSFGFRSLQRVGISVTPNHFYWPVPDLTRLQHRVWPEPSAPAGVDLRLRGDDGDGRCARTAPNIPSCRRRWASTQGAVPANGEASKTIDILVFESFHHCRIRAIRARGHAP